MNVYLGIGNAKGMPVLPFGQAFRPVAQRPLHKDGVVPAAELEPCAREAADFRKPVFGM